MINRKYALIGIMGISALTVLLKLLGINLGALDWVLGTFLTFVFPGYIVALLFVKNKISFAESVLISLGVSLIIDIFVGLIINFIPSGLTSSSWVIALGSIVVISGLIAILIQKENLNEEAFNFQFLNPGIVKPVLVFGLAIIVVIAAFMITQNGAANQSYPGFTQLWMLPAHTGTQDTVKLGVSNSESTVMNYILQLKIGDKVVYTSNSIQIKPGGQVETIVNLPAPQAKGEIVWAFLYLKDKPDSIYRWAKFTRSNP